MQLLNLRPLQNIGSLSFVIDPAKSELHLGDFNDHVLNEAFNSSPKINIPDEDPFDWYNESDF
jgi:hypothetical protein